MRGASTDLIARIGEDSTTLARLWRVTRVDGLVLRFTDAVRPVVVDGDTYRSDVSFTTSAIFTSRSASNSQSVTIEVVMDDLGLKEKDLRLRLYDSAYAEVMLVDYTFPEYGTMSLFTGNFATVKVTDKKRATIDISPTSAIINGTGIGTEKYQATCRASLGDLRCKFDMEGGKVAFTVASASGGSFVAAALSQASDHWTLGFVRWLTGDNAGTTSTVQAGDQGTTSLFLTSPPLNAIASGDTGEVLQGCDKTITTCKAKFDNVVNFRGEPQVPDGAGLPGSTYSLGDAPLGAKAK